MPPMHAETVFLDLIHHFAFFGEMIGKMLRGSEMDWIDSGYFKDN
jgi:hypothetical protein